MPAASSASGVASMVVRYIPEASLGVRKEQLLAVDLIVRDGCLPGRRGDPAYERLAELRLDARMLGRIHQHDSILVEQALVALDGDGEIAAIPKGEPGATIRQDIGVHAGGGVQRRPHPLAGIAVPGTFRARDVDAPHLPELELREIAAAMVTSGHERRFAFKYFFKCRNHILAAAHLGRV